MSFYLAFLAVMTMIAFAANSVFCRLALSDNNNDPLSFTLVRLISGAIVLSGFIVFYRKQKPFEISRSTALAPLLLFSYALFFSLSYMEIGAGAGALILFTVVQLTMMTAALVNGQRLSSWEMLGFLLAISGFVHLLWPGANMPPLVAALFMAIAGVSWGAYSLIGQKIDNPYLATSRNFLLTLPVAIVLIAISPIKLTNQGHLYAILSGALASGIGYILWYVVVKRVTTSTAAILQLSVPILAAFGGVLFLQETIHTRLIVAGLLTFSGIMIKIRAKGPR